MELSQADPRKIYMHVDYNGGWENISDITTTLINNVQYFYGIAFTPNNNCSLTGVRFLGTSFGNGKLKISQGNYASAIGTEYDVSSSDIINGEYTLPSSFSLTANTRYVVSFRSSTAGNFGANNVTIYPIQGNILKFEYGTHSDTNSPLAYVYCFSALEITV